MYIASLDCGNLAYLAGNTFVHRKPDGTKTAREFHLRKKDFEVFATLIYRTFSGTWKWWLKNKKKIAIATKAISFNLLCVH